MNATMDATKWRSERLRYEIVDASGTPIMEVVGTYSDAQRKCREIMDEQRRPMYLRGK